MNLCSIAPAYMASIRDAVKPIPRNPILGLDGIHSVAIFDFTGAR